MDTEAAHKAKRARSFGAVAQLYDKARPGYPAELFTHLGGLLGGSRILEVGAGTGKATAGLTALGLEVTCLEPDPYMAAVLADRTVADGSQVRIEVATLESFFAAVTYDGLFSAQAWHWTDPATRMDRAAALLRPGGIFGIFWNHAELRQEPIFAAIQGIYDEYELFGKDRPRDPSGTPADRAETRDPANEYVTEIAARPEFEYLGVTSYAREQDYTAAEFVEFQESTSHFQVLEPKLRERLLTAITTTIREQFDDLVTLSWLTRCYTARRLG